jgi:2-polyprenylphenol 6-hydroxylase
MGCILENANLMHACYQALKASNVQVTVASPTSLIQGTHSVEITLDQQQHVHVKLIVAADGVHSWVRQQLQIGVAFKSFHQTAIVANFTAEQGHQGVARQWFLPHETMALLPLPNHMVSMVWAVSTERAQTLLNLSQDELLVEVSNVSEDVLGKLSLSGEVVSFVLNQQTAESYIKDRVVLVGDAAHQVHPMAGQGVNLGFRDVMQLASMTTKLSTMQDIGDYHFLRRYERARKLDVVSMNTLTSGLDALFATSSPWLQQVTGWSMQKINQQDWLKKQLVQTATL